MNPMEHFSPFLPATYNVPEEEDRLKVYLVDKLSQIADVVNDKKIGVFTQTVENYSGESWAYLKNTKTRQGYQTMVYIPSYPNNTTLTFTLTSKDPLTEFPITAINKQFVVTQVWGSASKPPSAIGAEDGDYFSFYSQGNSKITFTMSDTTIVVTTTQDMRAYSGFIVIMYIRDGT